MLGYLLRRVIATIPVVVLISLLGLGGLDQRCPQQSASEGDEAGGEGVALRLLVDLVGRLAGALDDRARRGAGIEPGPVARSGL